MTDTPNTTIPTVAALLREWKISRAKCELDSLLHEGGEDACIATLYEPAWARQREIEAMLAEAEPANADELAGMIAMAVDILEEGGTDDQRELGVLRAARRGAYMLLDSWRQEKAA